MPKKTVPTKRTVAKTPDPESCNVTRLKQTLRTARSGEAYVFESDEWRIGREKKLPWTVLKERGINEQVSPELLISFRKIMAELVEEVSEGYARSVFNQMVALLQRCTTLITIDSFEAWRASLSRSKLSQDVKVNYLTSCRAGLNAWSDGEYPGLEEGLMNHVSRIFIARGSQSGRAVRELCPVRGPFTHPEDGAFILWLHESYADGALPMHVYAILLVLVEFGVRPVELAALRAGDVIEADADRSYQLRMPIAKGMRDYRLSFRTLELPADLYGLLKRVIAENQALVSEAWGQALSPRISKHLPLFVGQRLLGAGNVEAFEHRIGKTPQTFDIKVTDHIGHWLKRCPVTTSRLGGDLMPISLYRFRRTAATRLAEAGAGDELIATVLGHANTKSAKVYTAHTYEDQEACDAIMVRAWDPVLNIMADRLLDAPIPGQAKIHVTKDEPVGNCAQLCGGGIFNCYSCPKFRPFIDAPHEKALAEAESERQRRIAQGLRGPEVDSLDLPIAVIKETMRLCREQKNWVGKSWEV